MDIFKESDLESKSSVLRCFAFYAKAAIRSGVKRTVNYDRKAALKLGNRLNISFFLLWVENLPLDCKRSVYYPGRFSTGRYLTSNLTRHLL